MEYFVTSNGIPVHVNETGKGDEAIVLLHGYLETLYVWEDLREYLPKSSHIISIDLPGLGLTGSAMEVNSMEFDSAVLLGVLDRLSVSRVLIVGHSMGGYVGQRFLRDYPERISALINVNSNPFADDPDRLADRQKEINFILNGKLVQLAQIAVPNMFCKDNLRRCDERIAEIVEICETHDPSGVAAVVRGLMSRDDNVELIRRTSVPVCFIYGDSDIYMPLSKVEELRELLPQCRHEVVLHSGHNTHIEQPAVLGELISGILSKVSC